MEVNEYQTALEIHIEDLIDEYKIEWNKYTGYVYEVATPYYEHWLDQVIEYCDFSTHALIEE